MSDDAVLTLADLRIGEDGRVERYAIPFVVRDGAIREARDGDGAWLALAAAIGQARTIGALQDGDAATGPDAALICRPSSMFNDIWDAGPLADLAQADERPLAGDEQRALAGDEQRALGRDQSSTSVVLGDTLLLKAYRRIEPGLNPDLELTAYLSEEARFPGVPRLAGWAEAVTRDGGAATVAMLQAFIADADDLYETTAERLAELIGALHAVDMEAATEVAEDVGTLVAGLHAALASPPGDAPDLAPRLATHDELKAWRMDAHRLLSRAIPAVAAVDPETAAELRRESAAIAARGSRFEAVATAPLVMRIHADLHLGQVLVSDDGYRVIDFGGEPLRPIEDRRRLDSPLRDVASMLRSLDHVARSARRRAERRNGGPLDQPGLDADAWIERARERFLGAYADGLRAAGSRIMLDLDLLDAFEVTKETCEFVYAARVLPSWLWAPREGMLWLLAHGEDR
ncbi:MAG: hypothetical protein ACYC65_03645 [Candidatus Limnocylindrales bacterium]